MISCELKKEGCGEYAVLKALWDYSYARAMGAQTKETTKSTNTPTDVSPPARRDPVESVVRLLPPSDLSPKSTSNTRFVRHGCGSILDPSSKLEWYVGPDRDFGWQEASEWVATLQSCGGGWSMPSERQLASLFDITQTAGTGFFTGGRYFPAHFDPAFSQIGGGSWVWLAGRISAGVAPAYNANQNLAVRYSADGAKYPTRAFAVRVARAP
jgi:hypothetical protein